MNGCWRNSKELSGEMQDFADENTVIGVRDTCTAVARSKANDEGHAMPGPS